MDDSKPQREVTTAAGRVYQPHEGLAVVHIDYAPPVPLLGHSVFTHGSARKHPTEGLVVTFRETAKHDQVGPKGKKHKVTAPVTVRTSTRPELLQLVTLARHMEAEIRIEKRTEKAREDEERRANRQADVDAFKATLPEGYIAIDDVKHEPNAADGWGMTDYRHAGFELFPCEIHELAPKFHHPLGNAYALDVYVLAAGLAELVDRKRAEKTQKDAELAAKKAAKTAERVAKIQQARETGKPVELDRWTEECDGSADECDMDVCYRVAQVDGSVKVIRHHTH